MSTDEQSEDQVVTAGGRREHAASCTDELDCPCPACDVARQARVARGTRPRHADQPWSPR